MVLEVKNVSKSFKDKLVLDDINIKFEPGIYALLGVNGAGKTTLIKSIIGVLKTDSGNIFYNDKNIWDNIKSFRSEIGYMSQYATYYPMYTVYDFMEYICALNKIKKKGQRDLIINTLEEVNLKDEMNKKIKNLSGGMRQRLGLAQAVIKNPKILILDEPTAGLDPNERVRFRNLISKISQGKIVIVATHHIDDASKLADSILLLHEHRFYDTDSINQQLKDKENSDFDLEKYFFDITNGEVSDDYKTSFASDSKR